jgi:hypothetical protein
MDFELDALLANPASSAFTAELTILHPGSTTSTTTTPTTLATTTTSRHITTTWSSTSDYVQARATATALTMGNRPRGVVGMHMEEHTAETTERLRSMAYALTYIRLEDTIHRSFIPIPL